MPVDLLTRTEKGSILTTEEMDQNLIDLQDAVNIARSETITETSVAITADTKRTILCDCTSNDITVTLPPAASSLDTVYTIKKIDNTINHVQIEGDGGETLDEQPKMRIHDQWESLSVISDGAEWFTVYNKANAPVTLGVKSDTTTVTNTTTETLIYAYVFDADSFVEHEKVISRVSGSYSNVSPSSDFTLVVKLNGNIMHTLPRVSSGKENVGWFLKVDGTIRTIGATGTYVDVASFHDAEGMLTQAYANEIVIDTTVPLTYEVYIQWEAAHVDNIFACTQGSITTIR